MKRDQCACENPKIEMIRDTVLGQLPACRNCGRIAWEEFEERAKSLPRRPKFDETFYDEEFSEDYWGYLQEGFPKRTSWWRAIDEYRRRKRFTELTDNHESIDSEADPEFYFDLHRMIEKFWNRLENDRQRKLFAIILYENYLGLIQNPLRDQIIKVVHDMELKNFSLFEKARVLGFSTRDKALKTFKSVYSRLQNSWRQEILQLV